MPDIGLARLEDAESKKSFLIDTSDPQWRKEYHHRAMKKIEERNRLFGSIRVDHIDLRTDLPYLPILNKFFRVRERRYAR
jgi:hypothetical protein